MYMIRGSWDMLHLFCGCHGRELEMEDSAKGLAYACQEKREDGYPCNTRISIEEYEEILTYLSNLIVEAEINGEITDLTHTAWKTKKGVSCQVRQYRRDRIDINLDCEKRRRR